MATVYKVEMETVSSWVSYSPEQIQKFIESALKEFRDKKTGFKFERCEIKVVRK